MITRDHVIPYVGYDRGRGQNRGKEHGNNILIITTLLLQEVIMVVTLSNNTTTTMIGGVAEGVDHVVVGGAMDLVVEVEVMTILKNHHQVPIYDQ